jgi:signal transduction histidine kinase
VRRIPVLDAVTAACGLLVTLAEGDLWLTWGARPYLVQTLVSAGLSVALLLRRRFLVGAAVATWVLLAAMALNVWTSPVGTGTSPLLLCAPLTVVALARYGGARWWGATGAAVAVAGIPVSPALRLDRGGERIAPFERWDEIGWMLAAHVLVIAVAYLWAVRQREITERHVAELADVRAREAARADLAAAQERNRIAREVHDVVAHSVTLIRVEAATGLAIAETEPGHAQRSLARIKEVAGDAMSELRALLGLLRDGPASLAPAPSLTAMPAMLDRVRDAGLRLAADVPSPEVLTALDRRLGPAVRPAAVRVLQEGLTNVVKHADHSAPVHVLVSEDDGELRITVRNRAAAAAGRRGDGYGVAGLLERVDGVGGRLTTGRHGDEHLLEARLPVPAGPTGSHPAGTAVPDGSSA